MSNLEIIRSREIKERMSGNEAVSYAIRQVEPDVMPAFPITPSTEIPRMVRWTPILFRSRASIPQCLPLLALRQRERGP